MALRYCVGVSYGSGSVIRWASKKAAGSVKNKKNNTPGKRLGLKCGNGQSKTVENHLK